MSPRSDLTPIEYDAVDREIRQKREPYLTQASLATATTKRNAVPVAALGLGLMLGGLFFESVEVPKPAIAARVEYLTRAQAATRIIANNLEITTDDRSVLQEVQELETIVSEMEQTRKRTSDLADSLETELAQSRANQEYQNYEAARYESFAVNRASFLSGFALFILGYVTNVLAQGYYTGRANTRFKKENHALLERREQILRGE